MTRATRNHVEEVRRLLPFQPTLELLDRVAPLALWNERNEEFTCYAHPLGRGTFFYCEDGQDIILSSDLHQLARATDARAIDAETVAEFLLRRDNFPVDLTRTYVRGIKQIPPGHKLIWRAGCVRIEPYWLPSTDPFVETLSSVEAAVQVGDALMESVTRLLSSGPAACLVSGGLDSSTIAAAARRAADTLGQPLTLLTAGHAVDSPEERELQAELANFLGLPLHTPEHLIPAVDMSALRALNRISSSPAGGLFTGVFASLITEAANRDCSILLGGDGGDEVFTFHPYILADLISRRHWSAATQVLGYMTASMTGPRSHEVFIRSGVLPLLETAGSNRIRSTTRAYQYRKFWRWSDAWERDTFLSMFYGDFVNEHLESILARAGDDLAERRRHGWSLSTYDNYRRVIQISAYEPQWPYGDHAPVALANPLADLSVFRAAMSLRLDERISTSVGYESKDLLRRVSRRYLPPRLSDHRKVNTSALLQRMVKNCSGEAEEILSSSVLRGLGINIPERLLDTANIPAQAGQYWTQVLSLGVWIEQFREATRP